MRISKWEDSNDNDYYLDFTSSIDRLLHVFFTKIQMPIE